jgi:hypothetical protein
VPPASFSSLTSAELRQLRDLLEKVLAARQAETVAKEQVAATAS